MDEIYEIFQDVNCSKSELRRVLEGKRFSKWNPLEDLALLSERNSAHWDYITKTRTEEEIAARAAFLNVKI